MSTTGGVTIALDAMGGDNAPAATVAGALRARAEHGIQVILVGRPDELATALADAGAPAALPVVAAAQVITMSDDPAIALRGKPDASVRVAARLVAQGRAAALVSAGSTGATLAAALLEIGRLPGVRRPVVAVAIPTVAAPAAPPSAGSGPRPPAAPAAPPSPRDVVLVDAGGSPDVQPEALPAYARMGAAYARVRGADAPRVGLLNVGAEPRKGNELTRAAFDLLGAVEGFVGNVEPQVILSGGVDVVVTDGFTGNVFLKTVEAACARPTEPDRSAGAAVLLGVAGEVLVAHGAADEREVAAALRTAAEVSRSGLSRLVQKWLDAG